jgi:hypothetical protein
MVRLDLSEAIDFLKRRRAADQSAIETLERLQGGSQHSEIRIVGRKRGRKSMAPDERAEVAERMRKYWEGRRQGKAEGAS